MTANPSLSPSFLNWYLVQSPITHGSLSHRKCNQTLLCFAVLLDVLCSSLDTLITFTPRAVSGGYWNHIMGKKTDVCIVWLHFASWLESGWGQGTGSAMIWFTKEKHGLRHYSVAVEIVNKFRIPQQPIYMIYTDWTSNLFTSWQILNIFNALL